MSVVATIERLMAASETITVESVGGRAAIEAEQDDVTKSPYLDILVQWARDAAPEEQVFMDALVTQSVAEANYPAAFRDGCDRLLASPDLRTRIAATIVKALERRATDRGDNRNGLLAAYALETWFRMAVAGNVQRHRLLSVLVDIDPGENGLFVEHAAKIVGAAFHSWRENDLLPVLDGFRRNPTADAEASFEYGLAIMSIALDGGDLPEVAHGLESAAALFADTLRIDPDRSDAAVYSSVIEVIRGFSAGADQVVLDQAVDRLVSASADRAFLLSAGTTPDWLTPRTDREIRWIELLDRIPQLATDLNRPSWLHACEVLELLLRVYDADRTIAVGAGFEIMTRPRIEASFVREKGLLAHLDQWLAESEFDDDDWQAARELRERVSELAKEDTPGKSAESADTDKLRGALEKIGASQLLVDRVLAITDGWRLIDDRIANPIVHRVYVEIRSRLVAAVDYVGEIRETFDRLILQVIMFCMDRQDAGKRDLGARGDYLYSPSAVEGDLQKDLRDFLAGNLLGAEVRAEVEGIAKGRVDIYVGHGGWRFLIELKRHYGPVTPEAARSYIGQAASYQGTNVKLGLLGILELEDRQGPPPGLEDCIWYDSLVPQGGTAVRHLVVFRVPGQMKRPNKLSP